MSESEHSGDYPSYANHPFRYAGPLAAAALPEPSRGAESALAESSLAGWSQPSSSRQRLVAQLSEQSCFYIPPSQTWQNHNEAQATLQIAGFTAPPSLLPRQHGHGPSFRIEPLYPYQVEGYEGKSFPDAFKLYLSNIPVISCYSQSI